MSEQSPATILFVDDEVGNRQVLGYLFREAGYQVLEAGTGCEGVQIARSQRPDLVVLDVDLPDISGFEVCRRLRADPATRGMSILHLSAVFIRASDRTAGLEGGADGYLTKPVEPRELLATVKALLRVRAAEEAARLAAQEWRATFDAIGDGVCLVAADGLIHRCNRALADLVGRPVDELLGQSLDAVLHDGLGLDDEPGLVLATEEEGRDGQELLLGGRWFRVLTDAIRPLSGNEATTATLDAGKVVIFTDLTHRKQLEEQLRSSQRLEAVGRLAGGIAHDFNNLLTAILGNSSLLLGSLPSGEVEHTLAATIERAAWRAAELTRQLLGFSRQTLLWLQPVEPGRLIEGAVSALMPKLPAAVRLEVSCPPDLWPVQADPTQLAAVLSNLCLNALDAMPEGGRLTLEAANELVEPARAEEHAEARAGTFVRISVADTGEGIATELLDKVFDPFFTTKPLGRGTGLGLAMVHGIIKQHHGWVRCISAPGEGAQFDIYLPRAMVTTSSGIPTPTRLASPVGPRRILLADDNEPLRQLAAAYLQQSGFQVLLARDGKEAVELYNREHNRIDLVILDWLMPHLTGRDALRQIRRINPAVRVLLASGTLHSAHPELTDGTGVISKPYRERELLQAVHAAFLETVGSKP